MDKDKIIMKIHNLQNELDELRELIGDKECPHANICVVTQSNVEERKFFDNKNDGRIYPPYSYVKCEDCETTLRIQKITHKLE